MPGYKIHRFFLLLLVTGIVTLMGCTNIYDQDKYQHPDWLAGKLYTQISAEENLTTFKKCLELSGYDTIIDRTGSFTVFAPNNEAFTHYFSDHPEYGGEPENIPHEELTNLVKIHIIQDAWTLNQIQLLDVGGWIDPNDPANNKPRGYKRQSIYRDPDVKYWVDYQDGNYTIVDSTQSSDYRIVYSRSRKYVPIFFPEFFSVFGLSGEDYDFYFNRPFDNTTIHYVNAKVLGEEIFAENGFIFEVDQVVEPLKNVEQVLHSPSPGRSYQYMINLLRLFPDFRSDLDKTRNQPAAKAGLNFDTLYILNYSDLPYNIHEELTGPNTNVEEYTLRYHNGFLAPTDDAFNTFIQDILTASSGFPRWGSYESIPREVKRIIINNHMTETPVYATDIREGFYSGVGDLVKIQEDIIQEKYYASNATFLGISEVVVPRAFTSVAGPVYLRPGYSTFLYAIESAKVLPAIKKEEANYSFFILSDNTMYEDSSLMVYWKDKDANRYDLKAYDRINEKMLKMSSKLLSKRLLNQIGVSVPDGSANKEFIENLAGNFIVYDHINMGVRGGSATKYGFNGDSVITNTAREMEEKADNGVTYEVGGWFYPPNYNMYTALTSRVKFLELMEKAGMYNGNTYSFNFNTEGDNYTLFVPSDSALEESGADTLSVVELDLFLRYHFVKGDLIFTDGKKYSGDYPTMRVDESSTSLFTKFTPLEIVTGADYLEVFDRQGVMLGHIDEEEGKTNVMVTSNTVDGSTSPFDNITNAVIHDIDFVIRK